MQLELSTVKNRGVCPSRPSVALRDKRKQLRVSVVETKDDGGLANAGGVHIEIGLDIPEPVDPRGPWRRKRPRR